MHVEDGYELPIRVTFEEIDTDNYWHFDVAVVPKVGEEILIGSAPKGHRHIVSRVIHHIGSGSHRIVVKVARL